jgi:hypothetical protein
MKFKDTILTIEDSEYRDIDASSYSLLKDLDESGPQCLVNTKFHKQGEALTFGSLVDIILTSPERKNEIFHTKQLVLPTASLLELANALLVDLSIMEEGLSYLTNENIQTKIKQLGLWSNIKDNDKLQAKYDDPIFWNYIKESIEAKGKIIISQETLDAAEHCADVLLHHEFTKDYFIESEGVEVLKQPSIVFKFKGVQCKARIDLLRIDHNNKIIQVFDIKTGGKLPTKFEDSFYEFKYYLQVISYLLAVQSIIETVPDFKDYKIDNFKFLYISKKLPDVPTIYEVPEKLLNNFMDGWDGNVGFSELLSNYKYAKENNSYNIERKVIEKQGKLQITLR